PIGVNGRGDLVEQATLTYGNVHDLEGTSVIYGFHAGVGVQIGIPTSATDSLNGYSITFSWGPGADALAGNIALNNCFNASALHAAVTDKPGFVMAPQPNYLAPASFGSLELRQSSNTEFIGQKIDYSDGNLKPVRAITIDLLKLPRIDFIKIDIEGMEIE